MKKYTVPILWGITAIYGVLCLYLYYMQSIQPLDYDNRYFQSDLPYHISMIVDDGWYYSFTAYAYQILHWLNGGGTLLIAIFLALVTVGTVVLTNKLLCVLLERERTDALTLGGALVTNMVMPFFWEFAGAYRYVSYQSGNLWHNSTYLCMKLLALAAFLCYVQIEKGYREKITLKQWITLAVLLFVCTGVKPSYLTVFAPVLAVKLLIDLVRKVPFQQIFLLGATVLPACGVVLWQNMVLFGEKNIACVEAGGPVPGMGCAGRGIINALEKLESKGAYSAVKPDVVLYDVLGDVVCGGFAMPMRNGYADKVYIITSGENMSIYAAANIAMALKNFQSRNYAELGGFILNCRVVKDEANKVAALAEDFDSLITGIIPRSSLVAEAEEMQKTLLSAYPASDIAKAYRSLAEKIMEQNNA